MPAGRRAAVVGVVRGTDRADELRPTIETLLAGLADLTGTPVDPAEIELDGDWLGPGYGRPTPAAEAASRLLARSEGLLVDPIYTAKGLAGLIGAVRDGRFDGRRVVFWHAGGLPGLFEPLDPPSRLEAEGGRVPSAAMDHRRAQRRELVILAIAVVGLSRLLDGPLVWLAAALIAAAVAVGAAAYIADGRARDAPVEGVIMPALAAASPASGRSGSSRSGSCSCLRSPRRGC